MDSRLHQPDGGKGCSDPRRSWASRRRDQEQVEENIMSEVANAKFAPGDCVRIANANPPGHRRVPTYARGRVGTIERICGAFPNPEELAYGFDGLPKRPL